MTEKLEDIKLRFEEVGQTPDHDDREESQQEAKAEVNHVHQHIDQRLLDGFADEETFHLKNGHRAESEVGEEDD